MRQTPLRCRDSDPVVVNPFGYLSSYRHGLNAIFPLCLFSSRNPIMSTFKLISVKYGTSGTFDPWIEDGRTDAWFQNMAGSQQYFGWLSEYNTPTQSIRPGTYGGKFSIAANISQTFITDVEIVNTLIVALDHNEVPPPDETTLYTLHIPREVGIDFYGMLSCKIATSPKDGFCGYHFSFKYRGVQVKYAVLPYSSDFPNCGATFEDFSGTLSHEIAETITDPLGSSYRDDCNREIGDICAHINGFAKGTDNNDYPVQLLWSNSRRECYAGIPSTESTDASVKGSTKKTFLRSMR